MASLFLLSPNSLKGAALVQSSHLWPHSDGSLHHRRSSLPPHLLSLSLLQPKFILIVRGLEFHRSQWQWSFQCNDHRLHKEPMSDSYGTMIAVFVYHLLKRRWSNYLHSTHLDNIDSIRLVFFFGIVESVYFFPSLYDNSMQGFIISVYGTTTIPRHFCLRLQRHSWTKEDEARTKM